MKNIVLFGAMAILSTAVNAGGYAGVSMGRGKLPIDCAGGSCKDSVNVFKLYAGTRFSAPQQIDLGIATIDGLEVSYMKSQGATRTVSEPTKIKGLVLDEFGSDLIPAVIDVNVPFRQKLSVDALTIAPVIRVPLAAGMAVFAKPGVALVTATLDSEWDGRSQRSDSATKVKPYLAVGLEYEVYKGVALQGAFDWMGYKVSKQSGALRSFSLGAQVAF